MMRHLYVQRVRSRVVNIKGTRRGMGRVEREKLRLKLRGWRGIGGFRD